MPVSSDAPFYPYLSVHASAGSGKTHQLVNRLISLLLQGAEPGGILAITFTRRAAAEMSQRLLQRVRHLSTSEGRELEDCFVELSMTPSPELRERASGLYEFLLYHPYPIRCTTFHAFCQDLLRRFPMEADVPPGFDLLEMNGQLIEEAWDAYSDRLTRQPDSELAGAMEILLNKLGLEQSRRLLFEFVEHRSDWWALTLGQSNPVGYVHGHLQQALGVDEDQDPSAGFFAGNSVRQDLAEFQDLLQQQPNKTNSEYRDILAQALNETHAPELRYATAWSAFFTRSDEPLSRGRTITKKMVEQLGDSGAQRFLQLHESFCARLIELRRQRHAIETLQINRAWMRCGHALLGHYQDLKLNQRLLDFADLEWNSFLLLNTASHADWVQYKLDQRIDHLMVDEFQDTNPTQWQLLLPLLRELAAGESERQRSIMFVGDAKQSIYSFRRAEPRLFQAASHWLREHLPDAQRQSLRKSWRSSPAIMNFVNRIFTDNSSLQLPGFETHATAHESLYGQVVLLPLMNKQEADAGDGLRNPLLNSRPLSEAGHYHEAQLIAETIRQLVQRRILIGRPGQQRILCYSDIMLLFRTRTRVSEYERALREAHIPYIGTERGTLLESLEIRDMLNLLQWLITPFDNLALAGILRSPLYAVSEQDLMRLVGRGDWFARLQTVALELDEAHGLARAARQLQTWKPLADRLPVHDLLDRIYSETNIYARYRAAFPEHLHPRIMANLVRFLELALETDSGRYPSLTRFMGWLERLRQQDREAPDQPPGAGDQDRVRMLTVHEAKGLEAAVVFVADASRESRAARSTRCLVEWPADAAAPQSFALCPSEKYPNHYCEEVMQRLQQKEAQEDANLLYVALTRAEQYLYISAAEKSRGWYQEICRVYGLDSDSGDELICLQAHGSEETAQAAAQPVQQTAQILPNPGLSQPIALPDTPMEIAPSIQGSSHTGEGGQADGDARERGLLIHSMLEELARQPDLNLAQFLRRYGSVENVALEACWDEAGAVIAAFPELYKPEHYRFAYNEVPIVYSLSGRQVHGIIDRLIAYPDKLLVLDYKTQRLTKDTDPAEAATAFQAQLRLYAEGVRRCYPQIPVECRVLFTALPQCVSLPA